MRLPVSRFEIFWRKNVVKKREGKMLPFSAKNLWNSRSRAFFTRCGVAFSVIAVAWPPPLMVSCRYSLRELKKCSIPLHFAEASWNGNFFGNLG